jgi:hypothetical protein
MEQQMAFAVEDGTGLASANTYVDIPFVEGYLMGDRLTKFQALTPEQQEAAIITATQLVDISYNWQGRKAAYEQGLNWPRLDVSVDGYEVTGVPAAVKKAVCEAVYFVVTNEELYSTENDKFITSEKVDTLQVTYGRLTESGKAVSTRFEILDKLLRELYRPEIKAGGSSVGSARVERV